jgi:hypothetical protein
MIDQDWLGRFLLKNGKKRIVLERLDHLTSIVIFSLEVDPIKLFFLRFLFFSFKLGHFTIN